MSGPGRGGRGGRLLAGALLVLAVAGGVLLIAADFTTVIEIRLPGRVVGRVAGHAEHGYGMVVLGVAGLALALGARPVRSRVGAAALALVGVVGLVIALAHDLPDAHARGVVGAGFRLGSAHAASGLYIEALGAVLLLLAGGALLILAGSAPRS